ncbi:acyltransferase family protein [Vibrio europaeus]|uniref:Acyltransferase n=1 Tax=Vibrio europaeus TaxID=300876 RepID=A0A178JH02_9VIBR|nr:acyltransferase [Vibrio europaeus]MDC5706984.1 acyltransferase [Vibrio europaeus]MDC5712349.1 acyltransferase [Vibrio europaeus]MDC5716992.1 acyltransferase [Vibrio europaeus]MDC5726292.1 acyltransferase [Vibrio europaeus]MDC5731202.1 acyltransferase [Vibrio europaeus]
MNKRVSLYLDLLRFLSAIVVVLSHVAMERITGGSWEWIRALRIGSDTVIVFFVLSGYVIAYVADHNKERKCDYVINRLSRLYSVVIPALLLSVAVAVAGLGTTLVPDYYQSFWDSHRQSSVLQSFLAPIFYVNQIWLVDIRPFTNGPFWSLSYEFWYYTLFFMIYYFHGAIRILLALLVITIMGPKILLLAPVWWLGVWTYHKSKNINHSSLVGWALFLGPILAYSMIKVSGVSDLLLDETRSILGPRTVFRWLRFSDEFVISYVYAILVSMHFIGLVTVVKTHLAWLERWQKQIRFWAGLTFSLYLFHYPLMHFFAAVLPGPVDAFSRHIAMVVGIMAVTLLLGPLAESSKHSIRVLLRSIWEGLLRKPIKARA